MKRSGSLLTVLVSSLAFAAPAAAQGANDCASAQPISGTGTFAFDNTSATTDGPADCNGNAVHRDVWYRWTAPSTGSFKAALCGGVNISTRMVVYDGVNCAALNPLVCAGGNCGLQSYVLFPAVAGQQYLLRMGNRQSGAPGGAGTFAISINPCPSMQDDALEENDVCTLATPLGDGTYSDLFVSKVDTDWYEIHVPDTATLQIDVLFLHASGDIDIFLYDACGGTELAVGGSANDDETISYTNSSGCLQRCRLNVSHYLPDVNAECNTYDMIVTGSGSGGPVCDIGSNFCSSTLNSTGQAAEMSATGSASVAANDLVLHGGPTPNQPGLFFYSAGQANGGAGVPFGNGLRCVGNPTNPIFRLPPIVGSGNQHSFDVDYGNLPAGGDVVPGSLYHFQLWFRDPMGGGSLFNLSDGYSILFQP